MNKLKIVLIVIVSSIFSGLVFAQQKTGTGQTQAVHINSTKFKQKVFDYEKNKEWKFAGDKPCIIDFYADWCGPCRMIAPTVEQIAKDYKGKIDVYKVNVDEEKDLASAFGISSIPSILFCPVTDQPQMAQGAISKADFEKAIKEVLKVK